MPRRLKVPASEHSVSLSLHLPQAVMLESIGFHWGLHSVVRPNRRVLSNSLNSGLSPQSDVISRYSSFGIARLFFRITRASWACNSVRRSMALLRSSILYLVLLLLLLLLLSVLAKWLVRKTAVMKLVASLGEYLHKCHVDDCVTFTVYVIIHCIYPVTRRVLV